MDDHRLGGGTVGASGARATGVARSSGLGWWALMVLCWSLATGMVAGAAEVGEAFDGAARLYEQGKYREAAAAYEQLIARSNATVSVWFNLGNAWFKAGEKGRAIACYRRAERLAPRDPEISANLAWARAKVGTAATLQVAFVDRFLRLLTPNEWAAAAIVGVWGWFVLMMAREWAPKFLTLSNAASGLLAAGAALMLLVAYTAKVRNARVNAVVIASEATVRFGPLEEAQSAFTLPDGSELLVTDRKGAWMEVRDGMGRRGWVAVRNLATLP